MTEIRYDHLLNIPWQHGSDDCYGLGRRFFKDNYGIDLPDVARPDNWWSEPEGENLDLYASFRDHGFEVIHPRPRDIRVGDVALIAIYRDTIRHTAADTRRAPGLANHAAIFVDRSNQRNILHHFYSRRSEVIPYTGVWYNNTVSIIRHKDVPPPDETAKKFDYMSMITPELRRRIEPFVKNNVEAEEVLPAGGA